MNKKSNNSFNLKKSKEDIINLKKTLLNLNFQKSTGQLEKTSNIKKTRKNIAQLKTQYGELIKNAGDKNV